MLIRGETKTVVVFKPLERTEAPLATVVRGRWPSEPDKLHAVEISSISCLVGIWASPLSHNVYVLRKHPALDLCSPSEIGLVDAMERERAEEDED